MDLNDKQKESLKHIQQRLQALKASPTGKEKILIEDMEALINIIVPQLTLNELSIIPAGEIFDFGTSTDNDSGINLSGTGIELTWVAVRGGGEFDWAIYCDMKTMNHEHVKRTGNKVCMEDHIKRCVPCDDESYKNYRR